MACGIYKITNQMNGKVYIGQSTRIEERWKDHKQKPFLENSDEYNYPLYKAIRKYGLENFTFEVVEECLQEELNQKEIDYISLYESYPPEKEKGYNQTPGGNQGCPRKITKSMLSYIIKDLKEGLLGYSQIAKKYGLEASLIQKINYGRSYYHLENIDYPVRKRYFKIKNRSNHPQKIALPPKEDLLKDLYELRKDYLVAEKYGVSTMLLKDWKIKLGIPRKRPLVDKLYEEEYLRIVREEKPKNPNYMTPIKQIDKANGEIVQIFPNVVEASKYIQFHYQQNNSLINIQTCIHNCLSKQIKTACGFKWQYLKI